METDGPGPHHRHRCRIVIALFLLLSLLARPAAAQERRRVVMILSPGLTMDDLQSADSGALQAWARFGAVGVMNDVVPGPRSFLSATLTLATGQQAHSEPTDGLALDEDEKAPGGEPGTARTVYERRMGALSANQPLPANPIWHLGMASLEQRGLATDRLGAALARAVPPVRAELYGNTDTDMPDRRAALLTVDAAGIGAGRVGMRRENPGSPFGIVDDPLELMHALTESDADLVVLQLGDLGRAEAARAHLSATDYRQARHEALHRIHLLMSLLYPWISSQPTTDLLIISSYPPAEAHRYPVAWTRLTPVIAYGPDFRAGLLTSATTRTPGLIANVDIAPTLLQLFHAPIPQTMVGRSLQVTAKTTPVEERIAIVMRKEFVSALDEAVEAWGMVPITLICLLLIVIAMVQRRTKGPQAALRFAWAIVLLQNLTAATLLAPILIPPTAEEYTLRIAAWMGALTVAGYLMARSMKVSPPVAASVVLIALLVADTCMGQTLQKDSLLCSDAVSGLRYYGIGNEYLGPLLASALSGLFALLDDRGVRFPPKPAGRNARLVVAIAWLVLMVVLGWPGWGANAGSLACTGAGFGVGLALLCGRRITVGLAAACIGAGLVLAFGFGVVDAAHSGGATSHSGAALQAAAGGRGPGYLAEIVVRKVGMNLRLLASPPFWLLAAMALLPLGAGNTLVGGPLRRALARRPWSAHGIKATLAAIIAALLFKDSGVITAAGLFAVSCACPLYAALTDTEDSAPAEAKQTLSAET
jgi:hypothetical protein